MLASFLDSASTLKVAPHTWPELSTLGIAFNSFRGCSKLLRPPEDVKKQPLGNGAKDFPQPFFTISISSERTRWSSESVPQKKGTLPSASAAINAVFEELS